MGIFAALKLLDKSNLPQTSANDSTLNTLLTTFFIILGAIAVLMIVIAGTRYIFARGNAEKITQAKNMILYSVIGLILAALAASIVNVVINRAG
ncbi:MAG: pilin [Candidatus Saccharimonadales bacterium]